LVCVVRGWGGGGGGGGGGGLGKVNSDFKFFVVS